MAQRASVLHGVAKSRLGLSGDSAPVSFVIENADWAIRWYGEFIAEAANDLSPGIVRVTSDPATVTSGIAMFGSQYQCVEWAPHLSKRCKIVSTFLHGKPEDGPEVERHIEQFLGLSPQIERIVCSASIVRDRLVGWGVPREKTALIPIGCETDRFVGPTEAQRVAARQRFQIQPDAVVIGSFQKDGQGWGEGLEPKPIKGPDVLLEVLARLRNDLDIFVLLTGPARGFVKAGLERLQVPFAHHFADDRDDLASCYHALDLYLVTSREEGGPMALMESMASHVPVVSTPVGMAPDLIDDDRTGGLTSAVDPEEITAKALRVLKATQTNQSLIAAARERVLEADWAVVGGRHLHEVWQPILQTT